MIRLEIKQHYNINRDTGKISAVSSGKISTNILQVNKYELLVKVK